MEQTLHSMQTNFFWWSWHLPVLLLKRRFLCHLGHNLRQKNLERIRKASNNSKAPIITFSFVLKYLPFSLLNNHWLLVVLSHPCSQPCVLKSHSIKIYGLLFAFYWSIFGEHSSHLLKAIFRIAELIRLSAACSSILECLSLFSVVRLKLVGCAAGNEKIFLKLMWGVTLAL